MVFNEWICCEKISWMNGIEIVNEMLGSLDIDSFGEHLAHGISTVVSLFTVFIG